MDFLNRIAYSPQVQEALSEFLPGLRSKADQIFNMFGAKPSDQTPPQVAYGMYVAPEEQYGLMPVVPDEQYGNMPIVPPDTIEGRSKQFDFPPEYEAAVREQAIRDRSYIPSGPSAFYAP
tara:strand:+ start:289 stop:648 length:360 start_codon:yes stop_codon:yes gene_type:complete